MKKNLIGVCEECGITSKLHIHHKDRNHKNNIKDNLSLLCPSCHGVEHIIDSRASKQERLYTLNDWFTPQNTGNRIMKGFNLLQYWE